MPTFIVECYWPGLTEAQVRHALALVGRADNDGGTGEAVGRLWCILVPADGMATFLFHAPSALRLMQIAQQAGFPFDLIVESTHVRCDNDGEPLEQDPRPRGK